MLKENLINFFKEKGWWCENEIPQYRKALENLNVKQNNSSSFLQFYLHVEDMPTFLNNGEEIYQLGWFLVNTNLLDYLFIINDIFGLERSYIPLDSFEGENGYFYNTNNGEVIKVIAGQNIPAKTWGTFDDFLNYFFNL